MSKSPTATKSAIARAVAEAQTVTLKLEFVSNSAARDEVKKLREAGVGCFISFDSGRANVILSYRALNDAGVL